MFHRYDDWNAFFQHLSSSELNSPYRFVNNF
jgi:hypothetical protein